MMHRAVFLLQLVFCVVAKPEPSCHADDDSCNPQPNNSHSTAFLQHDAHRVLMIDEGDHAEENVTVEASRASFTNSAVAGDTYTLVGNDMRCNGIHRLGKWHDLGSGLTVEQCQKACSANPDCKFFAFKSSQGRCTSYSSCQNKQNIAGYSAMEKVPNDASGCANFCASSMESWDVKCTWHAEPANCKGCSTCSTTCTSFCLDDAQSWGAKCALDDCKVCDQCSAISTPAPVPETPIPTFEPAPMTPAPGTPTGTEGKTCHTWCSNMVDAGIMTWEERCDNKYCAGCESCPHGGVGCAPSCSVPKEGPFSWVERCEEPGCEGCLFCPDLLPIVESVYNLPAEANEYINLTILVQEVCFENECAYVRGYKKGPGTLGPTIHVKPGETLKVRLINTLGESNPGPQGDARAREKDGYIGYLNYTNFHTHGLHVSGRPGQDHVLTHVAPGKERLYDIVLPPDHMGGNHWYHDHTHHATAFHAGAGMAGMLVVEDEDGALPDRIKHMHQHLMMVTLMNFPRLKQFSESGQDNLKLYDVNEDSIFVAINGVHNPVLVLQGGKWNRFRMTFASIEMMLEMTLEANPKSNLPMPSCDLQLLAKDGIYLHEIPRAIKGIHLFPGARTDFAIRCSCSSPRCSAAFVSRDSESFERLGPETYDGPDPVLQLEIEASTQRDDDLPKFQVYRPCYLADLRSLEIDETSPNHIDIDFRHPDYPIRANRGMRIDTGPWFVLNKIDMPHDEEGLKANALATLQPATVYELRLTNMHHHPVHVHVNPYQLMDWATEHEMAEWKTDAFIDYYHSGDWHDVILHPQGSGRKYSSSVRMVTDRFFGEQVVHCHTLFHEDAGLMGWFWIEGEDGAEYPNAEDLDATCYRPSNGKSPGFTEVAA